MEVLTADAQNTNLGAGTRVYRGGHGVGTCSPTGTPRMCLMPLRCALDTKQGHRVELLSTMAPARNPPPVRHVGKSAKAKGDYSKLRCVHAHPAKAPTHLLKGRSNSYLYCSLDLSSISRRDVTLR